MSKASILIIEDSFLVAFHLQSALENEGYTVVAQFDNGPDAIKFVADSRPDLVLMDIMLNGEMDGIQLAGILKTDYGIPVVYITALTDKSTLNRANLVDPDGFLSKPFEDHEIFAAVEVALLRNKRE